MSKIPEWALEIAVGIEGDKAARGFFTTEEQARRGAGRAAIRQLGEE